MANVDDIFDCLMPFCRHAARYRIVSMDLSFPALGKVFTKLPVPQPAGLCGRHRAKCYDLTLPPKPVVHLAEAVAHQHGVHTRTALELTHLALTEIPEVRYEDTSRSPRSRPGTRSEE